MDNVAFPLTLTKRYLAAAYTIEDADGDSIAHMNPARADREEEGKFLVRAGNAYDTLLIAVVRSQTALARWQKEEPGISALFALQALQEILKDTALVNVVLDAQKEGPA
jgi:hypothetical protein